MIGFFALLRRLQKAASPLCLCGGLALTLCASEARAGFVGYYAPANFTLTNLQSGIDGDEQPTGNGDAVFPDLLTLVLTGTLDGSGLPGYTDLTIPSWGSGFFRFRYVFMTDDDPGYQFGGYLVGNQFVRLDDPLTSFTSGTVNVSVNAGELIGFRVGGDNQGYNAVLTITEFSAPVPEPGTLQLLSIAAAVLVGGGLYRRRTRRRTS